MSRRWVLTALGKDRPGIVARVTKILYELGCNLEDSAMTRLGGEFAVMLVFSAKRSLSRERLERCCRPLAQSLKLAVHLKMLTREELAARRMGPSYLITVYGADRPGIVWRVSNLLARRGVNITDVSTHRTSRKDTPLYLMLLEIELPRRLAVMRLQRQLQQLAKRLGVEVSLRSSEASVL